MSDSKKRIMARRSAFIAAAALTANCDRCTSHPTVCLSVAIQEDAGTVRPLVCLSAPPRPCLEMMPDPDAAIPDAGAKEGGAVTLTPIDIKVDASAPMPCLSVAVPHPTPKVCLSRVE